MPEPKIDDVTFFVENCSDVSVLENLNQIVVMRIREIRRRAAVTTRAKLKVGEKVKVSSRRRVFVGTITSLNKSRCVVEEQSDRPRSSESLKFFPPQRWNVPYSMVAKVG